MESFDRKIEVKSHRKSGSVMITNHKWKTAERLQEDEYCFVWWKMSEDPRIAIIQSPAERYLDSIKVWGQVVPNDV